MEHPSASLTQTQPRTTPGSGLRVDNVTKRFGGVTAVKSLNLSVALGEAVAVIGPNGAGKSSLLKLVSGVYRPDEGSVHFEGTRIDTLMPYEVARHGISLAHQVPQPFKGLTVRENLAIGAMARRKGASNRSNALGVEEILELCGLADKAQLQAQHLRLLDLKRLELARALSTDPALILLDEVAAGLNGRDLDDVIELIRGIHSTGRSLILVEHVEGVVASLVDRVLVIDWGEAIAEGTPSEVAADPKVREVYLGGGATSQTSTGTGRPQSDGTTALLSVQSVSAAYGDIVALREVSVDASPGEIVAVLGANGAGKSSLASVISGQLRATSGSITFDAGDITALPDFRRARLGVAHCPEGRRVFADLTIRENLCLSAPLRLNKADLLRRLESVHAIFPVLDSMGDRKAGLLSGGQQQMLAIGRALMSEPRLVVCDEISLGLAPVAIDALYEALVKIRDRGVAVILIEQNVHRCLAIADRVYVLERGRVTYSGPPDPLNDEALLDQFYFGKSATLPLPTRHQPPEKEDHP